MVQKQAIEGINESGSLASFSADMQSQFDRLTRLAAKVSGMPIALICVPGQSDNDEAQCISSVGLNTKQLSRSFSIFLTLATGERDACCISDAASNETLGNDPWVLGAPRVRTALGIPIMDAQGQAIAALWLFDDKQRSLDSSLPEGIEDVRALAAELLPSALQTRPAYNLNPVTKQTQATETSHSILDALYVFSGLLDLNGILLHANSVTLAASGLKSNDVVGKPLWDCYWWSYATKIQDKVRDAVVRARNGQVVRFEVNARLSENEYSPIDLQFCAIRDETGRSTNLIVSGVDVARRDRAEAQSQRLERIVEDAPVLIRSATPDGRVLYLNRRGRKMLGYEPDSDLSGALVAHHHPEWAMKILTREGYPTARSDGNWIGETAIVGTDGRELPTFHAIVAHRRPNGDVEFFSSIASDISGEKEAEEALRESEMRFRGTFENAAVGMAHVSLNGRWLRVNERLLEILGYGRAELIQKTFHDITHPDDVEAEQEMFTRLKESDIDSYLLEKRFYKKDGKVIWAEVTVSMQETLASAQPYLIAIVEDITERKTAEQRQRMLLAELNHRVKNTLAMIQSIANQTLRRSRDPRSFVNEFTGRLRSLSDAHDLLTAQTWDGADLAALLRTQISLHGMVDDVRIKLSGPNVLLPPQVALNLALIVHEMAMNALRHGAFSNDIGIVLVNWSLAAEPSAKDKTLAISWNENGGPEVREPTHNGFGSVMLQRGLKLGLGGDYSLDWREEGLHARLVVPLPDSGFRNELFQT